MADSAHRAPSLARIAYMPQGLGANLYPTLIVFENIDFFARLFGLRPREREARIARPAGARPGLRPFPTGPPASSPAA